MVERARKFKMIPSSSLCILLVYISSLISVFTPQVFGSTSSIKTNPLQDQPLIQTLEDIEALSYFLLSIFSNDRCKSSSGDRHNARDDARCSKNLTEANFLRFFDDLRPGADKMTRGSIDCEQETVEYLDLIGFSSGSNFSENNSKLNGEALRNKLKQICHEASRCQSSEEMLDLIRKKGSSNGDSEERSDLRVSNSIVKLCPVMMFQLHDSKCSQDFVAGDINQARPSSGSVWGFAILFVTIISFCSLVGVMIMPFIDKNSFQNMMNLFEGLAVGSLVGSAIFHLIPQAFDLVIKYPSHDFLWKALIIFGGIYLFFWSERIMKIAADFKRKRKLAQVNLPSSSSDPTNLANGFNAMKHVYFRDMGDDEKSQMPGNDAQSSHHLMETSLSNANNNPTSDKKGSSTSSLNKHFHSHFVDPSASGGEQTIATVAWMIILGDGLHNFIDGLSVGAAFSNSILTGISTSVAVICEEFPHELGDFAVLLSSGMTLRQAIGYNFLSACTCYLGMILGIIIGDSAAGSTYIFALAGGMFLYIALVDMMAELSTALDEALAQSSGKMIQALILQNIGILLGISTLFLLAKYSNRINFEGLAPFDQSELPIVSSVG